LVVLTKYGSSKQITAAGAAAVQQQCTLLYVELAPVFWAPTPHSAGPCLLPS